MKDRSFDQTFGYSGHCRCGVNEIRFVSHKALSSYQPRVCDCEYCQAHPSAVMSDPQATIELRSPSKDAYHLRRQGDGLAGFYHCATCDDLLLVACDIGGTMRGAVNAWLLDERHLLGEPVPIQPRKLSADQKVIRWAGLWGQVILAPAV